MWEAIRSNRRRSWILVFVMGILLAALGWTIGMAADPRPDVGGLAGVSLAVLIWLVLWLMAVLGGDSVLLVGSGAVEISKQDAPQLWNVVEEMTIAAGLPKMPRILIINRSAPNAFAMGRRPDKATVVVTSGLLRRLNRDELQGVIAHEIGHIRNLDIRYMVLVGVMLGAIVMIADGFLRTVRILSRGSRSSRGGGRGGGSIQLVFFVAALVLSLLAPLLAQLIYFACSRRREYLADASAAQFTRYPEGLASALEKIAGSAASMGDVSRAVAPMYTVNPRRGLLGGLFSTHPPTEKRIQVLRSMAGRAGLVDYEAAYNRVTGRKCIGKRTLESGGSLAARAPSPEPAAAELPVARAQAGPDLFRRLANFLYISCACGMRIKVPPGYRENSATCVRCGRTHPLPMALPIAVLGAGALAAGMDTREARDSGAATDSVGAGAAGSSAGKSPSRSAKPDQPPTLHYTRRSNGWESFRCQCGRTLQIGPAFSGSHLTCPSCGAQVDIT